MALNAALQYSFEVMISKYDLIKGWLSSKPIRILRIIFALCAIFSAHTVGFLLGFPLSTWSLFGSDLFLYHSSQLLLHAFIGFFAYYLAPIAVRAIMGFFNFIVAKFLLRRTLSIHHPAKLRWLAIREFSQERRRAPYIFILSSFSGIFAFSSSYLQQAVVALFFFIGLFLIFISQAFRGRIFPAAFSSSNFWLGSTIGNSLLVSATLFIFAAVGHARHSLLRTTNPATVLIGDTDTNVTMVSWSLLGPVFYSQEQNRYLIPSDGFTISFGTANVD